jgi:hypothetical protein
LNVQYVGHRHPSLGKARPRPSTWLGLRIAAERQKNVLEILDFSILQELLIATVTPGQFYLYLYLYLYYIFSIFICNRLLRFHTLLVVFVFINSFLPLIPDISVSTSSKANCQSATHTHTPHPAKHFLSRSPLSHNWPPHNHFSPTTIPQNLTSHTPRLNLPFCKTISSSNWPIAFDSCQILQSAPTSP